MATKTLAPPQSPAEPKFESWKQEGENLFINFQMTNEAHENAQWEIGDWLVKGDKFGKKAYAEAEAITGWDRSYLSTVVWVVGRFPDPSLRKEIPLKWSHFKELAYIEDDKLRKQVLDKVQEEIKGGKKYTVRRLRETVALALKKPSTPKNGTKGLVSASVLLKDSHRTLLTNLANARGKDRALVIGKIVRDHLTMNRKKISKEIATYQNKLQVERQKRRNQEKP